MKTFLRRSRIIALVWISSVAGSAMAQAPASASIAYDQQIAAARALAKEGSHALARDAFVAAKALAPSEAQRRWCELWTLEQDEAASPTDETRARILRDLARLLAPYENDQEGRDEFWAAAARVAGRANGPGGQPEMLLEVARYWAAQPVSASGAEALAGALVDLGHSLAKSHYLGSSDTNDALELLRQAIDSPALATRSERPQVMLLLARAMHVQRRALQLAPERVTAAYDAALAAARGTPFEPEARLHQANWALRSGPFGDGTWPDTDLPRPHLVNGPRSEAEFAELLALIDSALATVPAQPRDQDDAIIIHYLRTRRTALAAPSLVVNTSEALLPESRLTFHLTVQHLAEVELKLLRVSTDAWRELAFVRRASGDLPREIARAEPLHVWQVKTGVEGSLGRSTSRHTWQQPLAPGAYVLLARDLSGRFVQPVARWFVVTKMQAFAQRIGGGDLEVCVFDPETDQLPVTIRGQAWQGNAVHPLVAAEPGRARVATGALIGGRESIGIVGEAEGHPFVVPSVYLAPAVADGSWRVHLLADRPLYQPGETAQWKITVRQVLRGELQVPAREQLKITAKIRDDTELGSWEVTLNALGSASGQLALPATLAPGQVEFEVRRVNEAHAIAEIEAFRVEHFRAPEATLAIEPIDAGQIRRARGGEDVELKLTARYFSGEPLPNAKLTASIHFSRWANYAAFFPGLPAEHGNFPGVIPLSASTDARGEARLRVALPAGLPVYSTAQIRAGLAGDGLSASAMFEFNLLPGGCLVELAPAAQVKPRIEPSHPFAYNAASVARVHAFPQQPARIAIFARDGRHMPSPLAGEVVIERREWEEIWRTPEGGLVTGEPLRARQRRSLQWPPRESGWQQIHAAERREKIESVPVAIDASGRALVACPPLAAGCYRLSFIPEREERERPEPMAQLELFVADAATAWLPVHTDQPLLVPASSQPGEAVRVLAILPRENRRTLVSVGGLAGSESRLEMFSGNTRLIEFPWRAGYWAGAKIGIVALAAEESHRAEIDIVPSRVAHGTTVELTPLAAKSRPGEKAKLKLRTTDADGRPLASEIALSIADAAVTSLVKPGERNAADIFLAAESIPATLAVFGLRPANPPPNEPIKVVTSQRLDSEMIVLSPFEVSTSAERGYFAATTLAGSRVASSDAANAVSTATRVRGSFSYTAFWAPDVRTDARGEAIVEFSYPDNLTQWQVAAETIATGNRFGAAETTTQTALPFQARLRMPRAVVAGDTVGLVGALINAEPKATNVRVEFFAANNTVLALAAPATWQAIGVAASSETRVAGEARAVGPGEGIVRLTGIAESARDAMELKLPVLEDGFFQRTGVTARVAERPITVELALPERWIRRARRWSCRCRRASCRR